MNPISGRTETQANAAADERLAALVHNTVDEWRLPPQRLGRTTWRDRVGQHTHDRRQRWTARLAATTTMALVATILVAFVAVWLSAPRTDRSDIGKSPEGTVAAPSSRSSLLPVPSSLPATFLDGEPPDPASVMVRSSATFRIADLAGGVLGPQVIAAQSGPATVVARPNGGWLCICGRWVGSGLGRSPRGLDLTLETVAADGRSVATTALRSLRSGADPSLPESGQIVVDSDTSISVDGRFAFVGWSVLGTAGWTAGLDVVDVAAATVVTSITLPLDGPAETAGRPIIRISPRAALAPSGAELLISSSWFVEDPAAVPPSGTDHWIAAFDERTIGALELAGSSRGEQCGEVKGGLIDANRYFVLCWTPDERLMAVRVAADGSPIDQTEIPRFGGGLDGGALVVRLEDLLYLWDPVGGTLTRFNLRDATITTARATAATVSPESPDLLATIRRRFGQWFAPSASAKVLLEPALAVSPDGSRIYALGIDSAGGETTGSRGIFVFDADPFQAAAHWAPTADFLSLAVSADGRFLYAAGDAGRDAAGRETGQQASVTVYDTQDGSIRLIAGRLGGASLFFTGSTVR